MPRTWMRRPGPVAVRAALLALTLLQFAAAARGQAVLERVRARGAVACGAVARSGFAQASASAGWSGVAVDICRAVAVAALGPGGRVEFHGYASEAEFDRVRNAIDDVYFLTGAEINSHGLAGTLVPGPNVYIARNAVMVPVAAAEHHLGELGGAGICYLIGAAVERSLEASFERQHQTWLRHPFSEEGEMTDAYAARRCHGLAGEASWLAQQAGRTGAPGRILPEPLNVFPVIAATGTSDGHWSAIVGWTINTLVNGARPDGRWFAGGAAAMPLPGPQLGLAPGWQQSVLAVVGSYGAIVARHGAPGQSGSGPADAAADAAAVPDAGLLMPYVE